MTRTHAPAPLLVLMGVAGSGKSTIGTALAAKLAIPFVDGDDLHPRANVAKMTSGTPLDDDDRRPWLERIGVTLCAAQSTGLVVACSALKRRYRDAIRTHAPAAVFILLSAPREVLRARLMRRHGHFMQAGMLDSQLDALEPLAADERGTTIDVTAPVGEVLRRVLSTVQCPLSNPNAAVTGSVGKVRCAESP